jgi:hypothetical protein
MSLKKILKEAPAAHLASLYKQVGAEWHLDLEEEPESARLAEFRNENIKLRQQGEQQAAELKAIREMVEKVVAAPQAAPAGKPEGKPAEAPATLDGQVKHLTQLIEQERQARLTAEKNARRSSWESSFIQAATEAKVRDRSAANVLLALAKTTFVEDDQGGFVAKDEKGLPRYSPKSTEPYSIADFLAEHREGTYKDLFLTPQGGGGRGSGPGGSTPPAGKVIGLSEAPNLIEELAKGGTGIDPTR